MAPSGAGSDDGEVSVWRRIPPLHFPKKPRQERPDSSAFDDDSDTEPMSAVLADPSRDPSEVITGHEGYGLVELTAEVLHASGQQIVRDPQPDEPAHVLIVGKKTKARRRGLADASRWIIRPPAAHPPPDP